MKKLSTALIAVLAISLGSLISTYAAEQGTVGGVDFSISEQIEMTAAANAGELAITPLLITANSGEITLDSVKIEPLNGWNLVDYKTDFTLLPLDSHKFSMVAEQNSTKIKAGERKEITFKGKTGGTTAQLNTKVANVQVNLSPVTKSTVLISGEKFNRLIPNCYEIFFTDEAVPSGAEVTDVSAVGDGGVIAWLDDAGMYRISTQRPGIKISANPDSSYMFSEIQIYEIHFDNLSTKNTTNFEGMFSHTYIDRLDLSSFDTHSADNMSDMFPDFLSEIVLGSNFAFLDDGCSYLPPANIQGSDGYWYNKNGTAFLPKDIPDNKADTYTAISPYKPITITTYNRDKIGYTSNTANLVIPSVFRDRDGTLYRVTEVDDYAFRDEKQIFSVTISEGVTRIGDRAFYDCVGLYELNLPASLKLIEGAAFGCTERANQVTIRYAGSVAQWKSIIKNSSNTVLLENPVYCIDGIV